MSRQMKTSYESGISMNHFQTLEKDPIIFSSKLQLVVLRYLTPIQKQVAQRMILRLKGKQRQEMLLHKIMLLIFTGITIFLMAMVMQQHSLILRRLLSVVMPILLLEIMAIALKQEQKMQRLVITLFPFMGKRILFLKRLSGDMLFLKHQAIFQGRLLMLSLAQPLLRITPSRYFLKKVLLKAIAITSKKIFSVV